MSIDPSLDRLQASLVQSKTQTDNNPLYQTIFGLINFSRRIEQNINAAITNLVKIVQGDNPDNKPGGLTGAPYLTWATGIPTLNNFRQLLAGTGISFDDTVAHQRTINATVALDYVVLSDGYPASPSPINDGAGNFIYIPYSA